MAETVKVYIARIKEILKQSENKGVPYKSLYSKVKGRKGSRSDFKRAVTSLIKDGFIYETKNGFLLSKNKNIFKASVSRINKTFGFITDSENNEYFVSGRFMSGALAGDDVLAEPVEGKGGLPEAKIISIINEGSSEITGIVEKEYNQLFLRPDTVSNELLEIYEADIPLREGDRVLASVCSRGERHSGHKVRIISSFGDSDSAASSSKAILYMNNIETVFPSNVIDEAKYAEHKGFPEAEYNKRLDLRGEIIFTIDGSDTKDIDDAVSVRKTETGYELGVHIADVSFYVKPESELDKNAFSRGTSIYYANKVIPMLPEELSNGICSLNPNEDRLAFSALMKISGDGMLESYKFRKTIIKSRVKGVYSEINSLLDCLENNTDIPAELAEKYDGLTGSVIIMNELAGILTQNKLKRGAPQLETSESKLTVDDNDVCTGVKRHERGKSELIIEEFMLMANNAAAKTAKEAGIPFVYRVHENPSEERIKELIETVSLLNIEIPHFTSIKPVHLAKILEQTRDLPLSPVINRMVLRSMAKAKYFEEPLGHFGLVLDDYAHFTSPIRRYPDLSIHRILTDLCHNKKPPEYMQKRYAAFAHDSSEHSSLRELAAMRVERDCEDCYIAEYMHGHIGGEFEGIIVSVLDYGFFVELDNSVTGLVKIGSLKNGPYDFDGRFTYTKDGKPVYRTGDSVKVICVSSNISSGQVDFIVYGDEE